MALDYFQTAPWFRLAINPNTSKTHIETIGSRQKAQGLQNPLGSGLSTTGFSDSLYRRANGSSFPTGSTSSFELALAQFISSIGNNTGWSGLLGNIETSLFLNISDGYSEFINPDGTLNYTGVSQNGYGSYGYNGLSQLGLNLTVIQPLPWFAESTLVTDDELDDQLANDLLTTLDQLSIIDTSYGIRLNYQNIEAFPAVAAAIQAVSNMPWGSLRFNNVQNGRYSYMLQLGTDSRLLNIASYPSEGLRRMASQTMIAKAACTSKSLLELIIVKQIGAKVTITPVYRVMPRYISAKLHIPISLLSARVLFPFGLSFFIPLFVYTLTMEKQSRILIMMKVLPLMRVFTVVDEWFENMDIFPSALHRLSYLCSCFNDCISHCGCCFSSGNRLHQSWTHYHFTTCLD
jgi:hypothetical protein